MTYKFTAVALATLLGLGMFGSTGKAQSHVLRHIDQLAVQLERDVEAMHDEVHAHFRNTPQFRHLDHDVAEMEKLARHIHDVVHQGASIRHLRHDVNELDRLFHHVEDLVHDLAWSRRVDRRTIVHFQVSMQRIGRTLHHLRADLRALDVHDHGHHGHGHYGPGHSGHGHSHGGIGIGIGGFRLILRR